MRTRLTSVRHCALALAAAAALFWEESTAAAETGIFGAPDWHPPASWKLPKVCGKDFWTILRWPRDPIYDAYAPFAPGDEARNLAIFRESGDLITGQLRYYVEHHRPKNPAVPCYALGPRYAMGTHFIPPELQQDCYETYGPTYDHWLKSRKDHAAGMPEDAIDGSLKTAWRFHKLLPQWLVCELSRKAPIDRVRVTPRFVPSHPDLTIRFCLEVSTDGTTWAMVADRRKAALPIADTKGIEVTFSPAEAKFVRLTVTSIDAPGIQEVEAFRGKERLRFSRAQALTSHYGDAFLSRTEKGKLARKLGSSFLGFSIGEWGNDLGRVRQFWSGNTNVFNSNPGGVDIRRYVPKKPESAARYLAFLRNECRRLDTLLGSYALSTESDSRMLPYVAEWGTPVINAEFHLAGPYNYSLKWDILRGAARQHGRPAMAYLTSYNGGISSRGRKVRKRPVPKGHTVPWDDETPHNGVSLSFEKRWLWFNYLSGASLLDFEEDVYFYDVDKHRVQRLSPLGRIKVKWYEQVKKHPDRGIRATPIAIAFDYSYLLTRDMKFANGGPDEQEKKALYSLMWGGSFYDGVLRKEQVSYSFIAVDKTRQSRYRPEHGALRNRSFGEGFDWIMLNSPSGTGEKALQNYRAVYLLGRFDVTPAFTAALRSFLRQGGIVVAQASHLPLIPKEFRAITVKGHIDDSEDIHDEFTGRDYVMAPYRGPVLKDNVQGAYRLALTEATQPVRKVFRDKVNRPVVLWSKAGRGGIFWVLGESQGHNFFPILGDLLKQIADHALPIKVTGDIQWLANKTDDGWVIGLLNNLGVYPKHPYQEPDVDPRDQKEVVIEYPGEMADIQEWITEKRLKSRRDGSTSSLLVTVPAGDIRIVQFKAP